MRPREKLRLVGNPAGREDGVMRLSAVQLSGMLKLFLSGAEVGRNSFVAKFAGICLPRFVTKRE
jgi:hypothetical protein